MMSVQESDNESEAEPKPPDSSSLGVIGMKSTLCGMSKGKGSAVRHVSSSRGTERGRDTYDNTNPGITNETLEWPSQSCLFLLSRLL
jgi:hypothetical protein